MRRIWLFLFVSFTSVAANGAGLFGIPDVPVDSSDFVSADQIMQNATANTQCATKIFADALSANADAVTEYDHETDIRAWAYAIFYSPDVLNRVLACPEFVNAADDETIRFIPIQYEFPGGRKIVINYETQPKVLKQRLLLASRPNLPDGPSNPDIMGDGDAVWTNTDPAWYGIMVTQAGALRDMVGPDKNNVVSLKYISDNIDSLYPRDVGRGACTSRSGSEWTGGNDKDMINRAVHKTVGVDGDTNDYYVAGKINLQWLSYMEIALDVVITVVTFGGGTAVMGATKAARASRASKALVKTAKEMRGGIEGFKTYSELLTKHKKILNELETIDRARNATKYDELVKESKTIAEQISKMEKAEKGLKNAARVKDYSELVANAGKTRKQIKKYEDLIAAQRELKSLESKLKTADGVKKYGPRATELNKQIREASNGFVRSVEENESAVKNLQKSLKNTESKISEMEKYDDVIKEYREVSKSISEMQKYTREFRNLRKARVARTGNVATRTWRLFRAASTGGKKINRAAHVARSSMKSGRIKDWLFHSTMKNLTRLGKLERDAGFLYGVIKFAGDMYDWTETTNDEFTSGVDFAPLLLLSADDIQGQENVINYGMWMLWAGDYVSAADDDAAYLQAMDFAEKFHQDLVDSQESDGNVACDVDIYVVRPIIRNPGDDNAALYYLFMNGEPWTTRN
ncbi:MAG: hypothetical protein IJ560_00360 [Alphaproteobacteria bacterium]|nr:hypothetical protein [Alphaproteobacteria bacterium]